MVGTYTFISNAIRVAARVGIADLLKDKQKTAYEIFNCAMTGVSAQSTAAVAATYDFSRVTTIVDVGGGLGTLVATLLKQYPQMHGMLFDRPHVIAGARSFLETEGVAQRCELLSGDFFEAVPSGGDAYILQNIIHDWDD